ncbi:hypothetical protein M2387_000649 [Klebsiella sp. BIGb0407]|nr:hypothetical protein [Klebsiella sp. BIGb0407]
MKSPEATYKTHEITPDARYQVLLFWKISIAIKTDSLFKKKILFQHITNHILQNAAITEIG